MHLMTRLKGEKIAPRALEWLTSATEPRIHSLYRQSINLIGSDRRLLSVVLREVGPGPFAIVVERPDASFEGFNMLDLESSITINSRRIEIGPIQLDAGSAEEWQPQPDWRRFGEELDSAALMRLAALLHEHAPPGSFSPLANGTLFELDQTVQSQALHAAARPAEMLLTSLAAGDRAGAGDAAARLAGLGGGVTPSGDDYLQGAIHALWAKQSEVRARPMGEAIVSKTIPLTNVISGEWLRSAARGEAGEDWHLLAQAIATSHRVDRVDEMAIQLLRRGHTSGADAMAGFLATLSALG
jgi:hypothetical protein